MARPAGPCQGDQQDVSADLCTYTPAGRAGLSSQAWRGEYSSNNMRARWQASKWEGWVEQVPTALCGLAHAAEQRTAHPGPATRQLDKPSFLLHTSWPVLAPLMKALTVVVLFDLFVPSTPGCPAQCQSSVMSCPPFPVPTPPFLLLLGSSHLRNPVADDACCMSLPPSHASHQLPPHYPLPFNHSHLRDLMADDARCMSLIKEAEGMYIDFSRQRITAKTIDVRCGVLGP